MFYTGKEVFVVGGGNTACEEAVFLTRFASHVTLVVRKDHLRANPAVIESVMQNSKVEVRVLTSIVSMDGKELPSSITFRENETGKVYTWSSEEGSFGVFVFVGHEPATSLVDGLVDLAEDGTVKTDVTMATRTPGLFCAGDVRHTPLRQVITAASDGAIAATSAAQFLGQRAI
jgi:thioredoxin reductase (NADPH)